MSRIASLAFAFLLALSAASATAQTRLASATPSKRLVCAHGGKRGLIAGRARCLRVGMRCNVRFNTTRPSYRAYGFLCSAWDYAGPTTLFRIAQPGRAPATCKGIQPTPSSPHPGSQSAWVGGAPLWIGPYLDWRTEGAKGIWYYRQQTGREDRSGWGVKFLWELENNAGVTHVSFSDLATGKLLPVIIGVSGHLARTNAPVLDPKKPGHPDPFEQHPGVAEWGSVVIFPRAGCYRVDAQWAQGSTSIVFSFGR